MSRKFSDQFLIAASIAGDEQAFGKLYDKYVNDIYRFVVMRVGSTHEAQDLAAEVFLKAWQYISDRKKQVDDFRALLYRIARNMVIDHYRAGKRELAPFDEDQLDKVIDSSENPEEEAVRRDDVRLVLRVLEQLPPDYQEVVTLRYVQDLSIKEIATIQGKTSGAVRVSLHRAVKHIKELIADAS